GDEPGPARGITRRWTVMVPAAAAVLLACLAVGGYFVARRPTTLTNDDTLLQGLSVQLQQSPFLSLISDQQIQQTLALMGQAKDARLTAEIAQHVCQRTASAAVMDGSIASLGSQYVLGLRAKNCSTGSILAQEQIQAATREDVLNALSEIVRRLRPR